MIYERKETYLVEFIHNKLKENALSTEKSKFITLDGDKIKADSQRYELFQKNIKCVKCGCTGKFYAKEKNKDSKKYHLNLYAIVDGEERMMTKDHIIPKSKGGPNKLENYQTMCKKCNEEKGSDYDGIRIS